MGLFRKKAAVQEKDLRVHTLKVGEIVLIGNVVYEVRKDSLAQLPVLNLPVGQQGGQR